LKVNNTILGILRGTWLMNKTEAGHLLPIVASVISGTTEFEEVKPNLTLGINAASGNKTLFVEDQWDLRFHQRQGHFDEACSITLPIHGAVMKNSQSCGPAGSLEKASIIKSAQGIDNIKAIILDIDSPGGMVDGTQTLVDAIKASDKPVIAYIQDGMAASAAYWIASAADEIFASQKTDVIGSIGVYTTIADFKSYYETLGLKLTDVYSSRSTEKNGDYKEAIDGKPEKLVSKLDFIADEFISAVKENRTINLSAGDPFKGATYFAEEAIAIGLIDGIKSIEEVYQIAMDRGSTNINGVVAVQTSIPIEMNIEEKLNLLVSAEASVEDKAAARKAIKDSFEAEEVFAQADIDTAVSASVTAAEETKDEEITALNAKITLLEKNPAAAATPPAGGAGDPSAGDAPKTIDEIRAAIAASEQSNLLN
jgi:protease-4